MSDPRQCEHPGFGAGNHEMRYGPDKHAGIRVRTPRVSPPFDERPFEEIQEPVELGRRPGIPESTFWPMVRGKVHCSPS